VINDGIENIASLVPGNEKNKGAILGRTASYIEELQAQVGKFETERATLDAAIKELTKRVENSRDTIKQAYAEANKWQQRCRDAGLSFDDYDGPAPDFDGLHQSDLDAIGGS
jgi:transcriptional regulator CBF1